MVRRLPLEIKSKIGMENASMQYSDFQLEMHYCVIFVPISSIYNLVFINVSCTSLF